MLNRKLSFSFWVLASLMVSITLSHAETNPPEAPFSVGSSCDVVGVSYNWETLTRTKWAIDMLFALPTDLKEVEEWSSADSYRTEMSILLNGKTDSSSFVDACMILWPKFTGNFANVVIRLSREFTKTMKIVSCVDLIWTMESETQTSTVDLSDFMEVGDQPHVYDQTNPSVLSIAIQQMLDELNGQPGSDLSPSNTYELIQKGEGE